MKNVNMNTGNNFHYLIEIAIKIDQYLDEYEKLRCIRTKENLQTWHHKLKGWIQENYNDAGIDKKKMEDIFYSPKK